MFFKVKCSERLPDKNKKGDYFIIDKWGDKITDTWDGVNWAHDYKNVDNVFWLEETEL